VIAAAVVVEGCEVAAVAGLVGRGRWADGWRRPRRIWGRGGGGGMSDEQRARTRQTMDLAFTAPASLEIAAGDSSVTLSADGDKLALTTDGRKVRREPQADGEGAVDIKARGRGTTSSWSVVCRGEGRSARITCAPLMESSCMSS